MPQTHTRRWLRLTVICAFWLLSAEPRAAGTDGWDYDALASGLFWTQLYADGGWTLYCGEQFTADRRTTTGKAVGIEHIYSVDAMLNLLGCRTRAECRARPDGRFAKMEADMHNLYPDWQALVIYRNSREFGLVEGEYWRFDDCDVEWSSGTFEPRPIARGNVARALLYMHETYQVPLDAATLDVLRAWHAEDPPSRQERLRNDAIQKLQGRRNPWIDRNAPGNSRSVAAD